MKAAPAWLLDAVRPKPVPAHLSIYADYQVRDGHAYALAAVRGVLTEMSVARPGSRNQMAYRTAARLIELTLAPWARLDESEVQTAYLVACQQVDTDPTDPFTDGEAWSAWFSAARKVTTPALLPPTDMYGTAVPWQVSPTDFDQAGQDPAIAGGLFVAPGTLMPVAGQMINGPTGQAFVVADPFETAVLQEMGRLRVRDEAQKRHRAQAFGTVDFAQEALDDAGLEEIPEPDPLVTGWLDRDSLARINGPSGHGKSFVTLDLAACVATGRSWHGVAVSKAPVCYIVAEGARGMRRRTRAWRARHELNSTGVTFVPRAVQIGDPMWERFTAWCVAQRFGLIIFDTQAKCTVGLDENDATEMGTVVAALDGLRAATGACVLLVHHRGLRGEHGRGSTAVKGAMETELDVARQGTTVTLESRKQKDQEDPAPIRFTMNPLAGSVVLVAASDTLVVGSPFVSPATESMSLREKCAVAIAQALIEARGSGLTRAEAQTHCRVALGLGSDDSIKRVVRRAWADLVELGRIAKADGREAYFFLELDGAPILQPNPDKNVKGGPERYIP